MKELNDFIESWEGESGIKSVFVELKDYVFAQADATFVFNARPGVSYSLRAAHPNQKERSLYAMVDIVDDDPAERWLSICFYGDMVTDPEEKGDLIPEGLAGSDGYCFDIDDAVQEDADYVKARLKEAYESAVG